MTIIRYESFLEENFFSFISSHLMVKLRRICAVWVLHGFQINPKAGHKPPADDLIKYFLAIMAIIIITEEVVFVLCAQSITKYNLKT